jgi:IS30 family transposase
VTSLVERKSRFTFLLANEDKRSAAVIAAIADVLRPLPEEARRTVTFDRGTEFAAYPELARELDVTSYFCDPHSPWQRGSNENTNGLLRQYFPKGTDLAVHDQAALDRVAVELNGRPRQTLGWTTPAEKMAELLAGPD